MSSHSKQIKPGTGRYPASLALSISPSIIAGALLLLVIGCASQRPATPQASTPGTVLKPAQEVKPAPVSKHPWTLQGILSLEGSAPNIQAVISGKTTLFGKGNYYVVGPMKKEIASLAPGRISVRGAVMRKEESDDPSGKRKLRLEIEVVEYAR